VPTGGEEGSHPGEGATSNEEGAGLSRPDALREGLGELPAAVLAVRGMIAQVGRRVARALVAPEAPP
jgi:hypothetical protein